MVGRHRGLAMLADARCGCVVNLRGGGEPAAQRCRQEEKNDREATQHGGKIG